MTLTYQGTVVNARLDRPANVVWLTLEVGRGREEVELPVAAPCPFGLGDSVSLTLAPTPSKQLC